MFFFIVSGFIWLWLCLNAYLLVASCSLINSNGLNLLIAVTSGVWLVLLSHTWAYLIIKNLLHRKKLAYVLKNHNEFPYLTEKIIDVEIPTVNTNTNYAEEGGGFSDVRLYEWVTVKFDDVELTGSVVGFVDKTSRKYASVMVGEQWMHQSNMLQIARSP